MESVEEELDGITLLLDLIVARDYHTAIPRCGRHLRRAKAWGLVTTSETWRELILTKRGVEWRIDERGEHERHTTRLVP